MLSLGLLGCTSLWAVHASDAPARQQTPSTDAAALPPTSQPLLGERLGYHGWWFGLPVGYGWMEVREIVTVDAREAFHIEAQGHTNEILSAFYPIHDVVHSYLDRETLIPLRFEKNQREGRYRANEVVTFDHDRSLATYRSLLNGSVKDIPLPETYQDLISALYWLRAQPLHAGQAVTVKLYTDEKIYDTAIHAGSLLSLEILKRGTFQCIVVEPKAAFKGLLVKRGRIMAYLSADAHRLPLLVKATTPWGPMTAVLDAESIPPVIFLSQ